MERRRWCDSKYVCLAYSPQKKCQYVFGRNNFQAAFSWTPIMPGTVLYTWLPLICSLATALNEDCWRKDSRRDAALELDGIIFPQVMLQTSFGNDVSRGRKKKRRMYYRQCFTQLLGTTHHCPGNFPLWEAVWLLSVTRHYCSTMSN